MAKAQIARIFTEQTIEPVAVLLLRDAIHADRGVLAQSPEGTAQGVYVDQACQRVELCVGRTPHSLDDAMGVRETERRSVPMALGSALI
jgi:hypothetical protein